MKKYLSLLMMVIAVAVLTMECTSLAEARGHGVTLRDKKIFKQHHHRFKHKVKDSSETNNSQETNVAKPLDLAVPFKSLEMSDAPRQINGLQQSESGFFVDNNQDSRHALQLKGQVVMSQELEADKKKSVDGAGIMINLRR